MICGTRGAETLRTVCFGEPYAGIVWDPDDAVVIYDDLLMAFSWFSHGFRMVRSRFVPSPTFQAKRISFF